MTESAAGPRRSLGGQVVERGLELAGFDPHGVPGLTLVETAKPGRAAFDTVLAQNAWNVIELRTFARILRSYPAKKVPTYVGRRLVAQANLRRAGRVVCLTDAMGALCERYSRKVEVAALTVPMDLIGPAESASPLPPGTLLVPGTVTWHKNPLAALELVAQLREPVAGVLYAGSDDGSGAWQQVQAHASELGVDVQRRTLSRAEMRAACETASAVAVPSRLESLSFSLSEALAFSPSVIASPLPAHRELAARLGREPSWLVEGRIQTAAASEPVAAQRDLATYASEWRSLGERLGLPGVEPRSAT